MIDWYNKQLKKMNIWDIQLIKIGAAAITLTLAKLWSPLLSLEWYWYLIIAVVAVLGPVSKICKCKR